MRKFDLPQELLIQFCSTIIESVLCTSITVWFSSATKSDPRRLWMVARTAEPTNSLSHKIIILHKTNKKTCLVNCWPSGKYVHVLYMYSILGRGSFYFNYCLNSAWHGGDQFVALLRWYGSPGFFDSGLQLICIFWSLVSHFPLDNTP